MKTCSKCHNNKSETDFYRWKRSADGLQSACKQCMKIAYNLSRTRKKEHYNAVRRARAEQNRQRVLAWKAEQRCKFCSEGDPVCLDLHHLDPNQKDVTVSDVVAFWSWSRLINEIEKCVVVCANCHRKIHKGRI